MEKLKWFFILVVTVMYYWDLNGTRSFLLFSLAAAKQLGTDYPYLVGMVLYVTPIILVLTAPFGVVKEISDILSKKK